MALKNGTMDAHGISSRQNKKNNKKGKEENEMDCNEGEIPDVEKILEEVVSMEKWEGKRASKLDLDDFLELLAEFNKRGIHFA